MKPSKGLVLDSTGFGGWEKNGYRDHLGSRNFNGSIDELILFDRVLEESEVQELYALGQP